MTCTATNRAIQPPIIADPPSKNRAWNFFSSSTTHARFFASQILEPHQENPPTSTTTASGLSFWINQDPLNEVYSHGIITAYLDEIGIAIRYETRGKDKLNNEVYESKQCPYDYIKQGKSRLNKDKSSMEDLMNGEISIFASYNYIGNEPISGYDLVGLCEEDSAGKCKSAESCETTDCYGNKISGKCTTKKILWGHYCKCE